MAYRVRFPDGTTWDAVENNREALVRLVNVGGNVYNQIWYLEWNGRLDGAMPSYWDIVWRTTPDGYIWAESGDGWTCICGNTAAGDGFHPVVGTDDGWKIVEPETGVWTDQLYACVCGRIIDASTFDADNERVKIVAFVNPIGLNFS